MRPVVVAFLRGALEAAVLAVIGVAVVALGDVTTGQLAPWAPIALLALRQIEGLVDQKIDPTTQRLGGGAPDDLAQAKASHPSH